jgi:type II secretory pathway pseudopilin PulG
MGLKLEVVLVMTIAGIVAGSLMLKLGGIETKGEVFTKELEFTNTMLIEVNTLKSISKSYGTYGVRDRGVFTLDNLQYSTDTIESLVADHGRFQGDILYLDGAVVLKEKEGYTYETEHANYNQKSNILNITAPFVGTRDRNIINGNTLRYNTRKKEAFGTKIDSVLYTTEK